MARPTANPLMNFKETFKESLLKNHLASSLAQRLLGTLQSLKKPNKILLDDEPFVALQVSTRPFSKAPRDMRKELWLSCLHQRGGIGTTAAQKYKDMVHQEVSVEVAEQIDKDLGRTFPAYKRFNKEQGKMALRNVLRAYASYDPEVGYCQGMNFLTGLLLMYLAEEDAFGALVVIMHERGFRDYYRDDMALLQKHLWHLGKLMPQELCKHLETCGVVPVLFGASWFMTCFAADFPALFAARLLDVVMVGNIDVVMLKVSLEVLLESTDKLMAKTDLEDILGFFKIDLPGMDEEVLQDILTKAFAEPWDAKQLAVLASSDGAESIAEAMARVHIPQQLLQTSEPIELSPMSSGVPTPEVMSPTAVSSPRHTSEAIQPALVLLPPPPTQRSARTSQSGVVAEGGEELPRANSHYCYQLLSTSDGAAAVKPDGDAPSPDGALAEPEAQQTVSPVRGELARLLGTTSPLAAPSATRAADHSAIWEDGEALPPRPNGLRKSITQVHRSVLRPPLHQHQASVDSGLDALANGLIRPSSLPDIPTLPIFVAGQHSPTPQLSTSGTPTVHTPPAASPKHSPHHSIVDAALWTSTASLQVTSNPGVTTAATDAIPDIMDADGLTSISDASSLHSSVPRNWAGTGSFNSSTNTPNLLDLDSYPALMASLSDPSNAASAAQQLQHAAAVALQQGAPRTTTAASNLGSAAGSCSRVRRSSAGESDWDDLLQPASQGDSRDMSFSTLRSSDAPDTNTSRQSSLPLGWEGYSRTVSQPDTFEAAGIDATDAAQMMEFARQASAELYGELSFSDIAAQPLMQEVDRLRQLALRSPEVMSMVQAALHMPTQHKPDSDALHGLLPDSPIDLISSDMPPRAASPPPMKDYISPTRPGHRRKMSDIEAHQPLLGNLDSPVANIVNSLHSTPRDMLGEAIPEGAQHLLGSLAPAGQHGVVATPRLGQPLGQRARHERRSPDTDLDMLLEEQMDAPPTLMQRPSHTAQERPAPEVVHIEADAPPQASLASQGQAAELNLLGSPVLPAGGNEVQDGGPRDILADLDIASNRCTGATAATTSVSPLLSPTSSAEHGGISVPSQTAADGAETAQPGAATRGELPDSHLPAASSATTSISLLGSPIDSLVALPQDVGASLGGHQRSSSVTLLEPELASIMGLESLKEDLDNTLRLSRQSSTSMDCRLQRALSVSSSSRSSSQPTSPRDLLISPTQTPGDLTPPISSALMTPFANIGAPSASGAGSLTRQASVRAQETAAQRSSSTPAGAAPQPAVHDAATSQPATSNITNISSNTLLSPFAAPMLPEEPTNPPSYPTGPQIPLAHGQEASLSYGFPRVCSAPISTLSDNPTSSPSKQGRFRSAAHAVMSGRRVLVSRFQDVVTLALQKQRSRSPTLTPPPGRSPAVSPRRDRTTVDDTKTLEESILANIESFASVPSTIGSHHSMPGLSLNAMASMGSSAMACSGPLASGGTLSSSGPLPSAGPLPGQDSAPAAAATGEWGPLQAAASIPISGWVQVAVPALLAAQRSTSPPPQPSGWALSSVSSMPDLHTLQQLAGSAPVGAAPPSPWRLAPTVAGPSLSSPSSMADLLATALHPSTSPPGGQPGMVQAGPPASLAGCHSAGWLPASFSASTTTAAGLAAMCSGPALGGSNVHSGLSVSVPIIGGMSSGGLTAMSPGSLPGTSSQPMMQLAGSQAAIMGFHVVTPAPQATNPLAMSSGGLPPVAGSGQQSLVSQALRTGMPSGTSPMVGMHRVASAAAPISSMAPAPLATCTSPTSSSLQLAASAAVPAVAAAPVATPPTGRTGVGYTPTSNEELNKKLDSFLADAL